MISGRLGFVVRRGFQLQAGHQSKKSRSTMFSIVIELPQNRQYAPFWHRKMAHVRQYGTSRRPLPRVPLPLPLLLSRAGQYSQSEEISTLPDPGELVISDAAGPTSIISMARTSKPEKTSTHSDRTLRRIGKLKRERAELEEEVLQLRAAVKIWTAVCDQAMSRGEDPESCSAEMQ
jgi:hypothetical protein